MGVEYYLFAIFIAILVCIVAIVFKVLFSNVKKQNKMLDERERQVLETYNAVETIMEEFQDQAKATIDELNLREQEYRAALQNMAAFKLPPELEHQEKVMSSVPRSVSLDANKSRVASNIIEQAEHLLIPEPSLTPTVNGSQASTVASPARPEIKAAVFQSFFDDAADAPPPTPYSPVQVSGSSRRDAILSLADEGKTDVEIASTLGITRNEVQLVVGLRN